MIRARGGGRRDYSSRVGHPTWGVAYSFTVAMMPTRKESARLHPGKFAVGLVMHIGTILGMILVIVTLIRPDLGLWAMALLRPLVAASLLAGLYLFLRRLSSPNLRAMSVLDDYVAILATCGLLALTLVCSAYDQGRSALLIYAAVFLFYFPLGKLRHAVFFFVVRADLGRRLGYRGVYPSVTVETE